MYKVTNNKQKLVLSICLTVLILSGQQSAFSTTLNTTSEIKIKADYMVLDMKTGSNIYKGNVSIVQDAIKLTGNKVTILRSNDKINDIEVTGDPARYLQDENTDNMVHAMSQQIHYSAQQNRLVLTDEASLEQANHTVKSQRIIYDTEKKVIIAGNTDTRINVEKDDPKQRVNITLTPKKNGHEKDHN